ncbi:MAG: AAA family ATPase [Candidatus Helarchaeota archaeon]
MVQEIVIQVEDLGPISHSKIILGDLTIFVGPNNTGKSYKAMFIHLLLRTFRTLPFLDYYIFRRIFLEVDDLRVPFPRSWGRTLELEKLLEDEEFNRWLLEVLDKMDSGTTTEFPPSIQQRFEKLLNDEIRNTLETTLVREIKKTFSCTFKDLTKAKTKCFKITLKSNEFNIELECEGESLKINKMEISSYPILITKRIMKKTKIPKFTLKFKEKSPLKRKFELRRPLFNGIEPNFLILEAIIDLLTREYARKFSYLVNYKSSYLPATRSGLLQGYKAISAAYMRLTPYAGLEPLDYPTLSVIVSDYIIKLIEIKDEKKKEETKYSHLVKLLEDEILKGEIEIIYDKQTQTSEILYTTSEYSLPISRTSSMISELAPISLYLKHIITDEDYIIIEEPESHLHPHAQASFARVVVKMIRSGLKVLITSHSDYFLQELNNFIKASGINISQRKKLGFDKEDYIKPEEIRAYLFDFDEKRKGTVTKELEITEGGITTEHLTYVADAIYDKTIKLENP